jgi:hypothetical protein
MEEIKFMIIAFHSIDNKIQIYVMSINHEDPKEIDPKKLNKWSNISVSSFFILEGQHTMMDVKVSFSFNYLF